MFTLGGEHFSSAPKMFTSAPKMIHPPDPKCSPPRRKCSPSRSKMFTLQVQNVHLRAENVHPPDPKCSPSRSKMFTSTPKMFTSRSKMFTSGRGENSQCDDCDLVLLAREYDNCSGWLSLQISSRRCFDALQLPPPVRQQVNLHLPTMEGEWTESQNSFLFEEQQH